MQGKEIKEREKQIKQANLEIEKQGKIIARLNEHLSLRHSLLERFDAVSVENVALKQKFNAAMSKLRQAEELQSEHEKLQ